jgi:hypothetical protein
VINCQIRRFIRLIWFFIFQNEEVNNIHWPPLTSIINILQL